MARALDLLNFLLADVRDGLGPYLSIYLLLAHRWDQGSIGFVMAVGGIGAIVAQAPAGAPAGTTGQCNDGSWYSGATKKGACRGHKGVKEWYGATDAAPAKTSPKWW